MYLPLGQPTLLATFKSPSFNNDETDAIVNIAPVANGKRSGKTDAASQQPYLPETDAFVSVRCSKDRLLTLLVRELSIALWSISPPLQLSAHRRSRDSLEQHGHNISAVWQPDSSYVAIQTSKDFVLIFFIDDSSSQHSNAANHYADNHDIDDADSVYELRTTNASNTLQAVFDAQPTIFRRTLYLSAIVPVPQGVACLEALRTELFIATNEDVIRSMRWDQQALQQNIENNELSDEDDDDSDSGAERSVDNPAFFYLSKVPIVVDALDASRNTFYHPSVQIFDCEYSFLLGGFAVVLSDGSAAFLRTSPGADIFNANDPNKLCFQVPSIISSSSSQSSSTGAAAVYTCTSVNHRFRLMAFGCRDSTCIVCSVDDGGGGGGSAAQGGTNPVASAGGRIVVLHRLELPRKECDQEPSRMCGAVTRVAWTSDGSALALTWERGGMSLWSTFGSLLLYQPRWSNLLPANSREYNSLISVDWSADNYSLMLLSEKCFMKLSMVKAAWTANNVYSNRQYLLLHGDKQVLFNTGDRVVPIPELADEAAQQNGAGSSPAKQQQQSAANSDAADSSRNNNVVVKHKLFSNKLWLHLQPPEQYIVPNMPLRCAAVSADGLYIACAGRTGFCYYSCAQRRWRMFGNVRQERSFFVTNALGWWQDNVVAGCYNWRNGARGGNSNNKNAQAGGGVHEIRVYPRAENLDDAKAYVWPTPCTVLQLNVYDDLLTCFMSDGNVLLSRFIRASSNNKTSGAQIAANDAAVANGKSAGGFFYNPLRKRKSQTNLPTPTPLLLQREAVLQEIQLLQIIDINNIMPHPGCVLSVDLTPVRTEASIPADLPTTNVVVAREVESLIINVCGKLIMIQREAPPGSVQSQHSSYHTTSSSSGTPIPGGANPNSKAAISNSNFSLLLPGDNNPVLLASCVENFWINSSNSLHVRHSKPHLTEALWMHCGSHGLKVWLPLFPNPQERTHNFISKRIMLPTNLDIYPLAINFPDAIIHSAENEVQIPPPPVPSAGIKRLSISSMDSSSLNNAVPPSDSSSLQSFRGQTKSSEAGGRNSLPHFTIHRTTEVYLPHILRQLLRRNLGVHALDIAESCRALPYFDHTLELLLHHVLEEEGGPTSTGGGANISGGLSLMAVTGNFTIPDAPLLPAVCAFVHEFDVFLDIIAHCARKTDISLWPKLFAQVGHPADLFRECLRMGKLATAASFLVVMQAQMRPSEVRPLANALLQATRMAHDADLESEMSRYLAILELEERAELAELLGGPNNNVAGSISGGGGRAQSPPLLTATPVIPYATSAATPMLPAKVDPKQLQQQKQRRQQQQQDVSSFKYGPATPATSVVPAFHHLQQQFRKLPSVSHHGGATQMVSDSAANGTANGGVILTSSMSVIENGGSRRKSTATMPAGVAAQHQHHQQLHRRITIAPSSASPMQQQPPLMPTTSRSVGGISNPSAMNTPPGSIVSSSTGRAPMFLQNNSNAAVPSNAVLSTISDPTNDAVVFDSTDRRRRSTKSRNRSGTAGSASLIRPVTPTAKNQNSAVFFNNTSAVVAKAQRSKTASRTMSESNAIDGEDTDDERSNLSVSSAVPTKSAMKNRPEIFLNKNAPPATVDEHAEFAINQPLQAVKNGYDPYVHLFPSFSDDVGLSQLSSPPTGTKVADSINSTTLGRSSSEAAMNHWLQSQLQQPGATTASPGQINNATVGGSGGGLMMRSKTRALPGRARMFFGNAPSSVNVPVATASTNANMLRSQQVQHQQFSPVMQHRNNN